MAILTRAQARIDRTRRTEANTPKKCKFYNAWDSKSEGVGLRPIAKSIGTSKSTAERWLKERQLYGSPSKRSTRQYSNKLGRPLKVSSKLCKTLLNPTENPDRDQHYEVMRENLEIDACTRTIIRSLKQNTKNARRYKQAFRKKAISVKNRKQREQYGKEHRDKTIDDFWSGIMFTDEAHLDPTSQQQGYILREEGTRYNTENVQIRGEKKGIKLHIAGWVNWYAKGELEFYHDEEDSIEPPTRPAKPRKSKYQSEDEYKARIVEWEAAIGHEKEVKPKGNSMTQKYYVERLLPGYIRDLKNLQEQYGGGDKWQFQEDGDPSHGKRKNGLAEQLRVKENIHCFTHPAQSPDLNPMEGVWNILKQRIRRRRYKNLEEYKMVVLEEWDKITLAEIQSRISDMPGRCKILARTGGQAIKDAKW
jgi:hypothetical protein